MTTTAAARAERLARARKEQAERGVDALLLGPSPDLAYLTGYHPPHLERLTMLVVPAAGDPRLVVPALEAPLAAPDLIPLDTAGGDSPAQVVLDAALLHSLSPLEKGQLPPDRRPMRWECSDARSPVRSASSTS